jgi:hypothetical protein
MPKKSQQQSLSTSAITGDLIERKIYVIRGQKVMLDRDLAELYGVPAKRLNEQVHRNIKRFPEDFMFQLTEYEFEILRSQFATLRSAIHGKHTKYLPYAFTEQGVAMLSGVLRSNRAIEVNIEIMRAFVRFRHILSSQKELTKIVTELRSFVLKGSAKTDQEIRKIWVAIEKLSKPSEPDEDRPYARRTIGFNVDR